MTERIIFLGQAGLLFVIDGKKVIVDPYFSNDVSLIQPENYRRQKIDEKSAELQPDILIITHSHIDHYDKTTVEKYLKRGGVTVLSPYTVWSDIRKNGGNNEYVLFNVGTSVTQSGVKFQAIYAAHSDDSAIGVVISDGYSNYYVTGDTLYSEKVFESLPKIKIKATFLPINGKGNNMNVTDAERFARRVKSKYVVPVHFGMFDEMTGEELKVKNAVVPRIYEEIKLK